MTATDGEVLGITRICGDEDDRGKWNLVILGDGYTRDDLDHGRYADDANGFVEAFFATEPFDRLAARINVHRVDVRSDEGGAAEPTACNLSGANPSTFFDSTFCSWWGNERLERLLTVDTARAIETAESMLPQTTQVLVMVNSTRYGGSGGAIAVCSMNPQAFRVAIHEIGHVFGLADEYDEDGGATPIDEPLEPNVTIDATPANKWGDLMTSPMPYQGNPHCAGFSPPAAIALPGDVGAFEGASYSPCGVFRPSQTCCMREVREPFCRVCVRAIECAFDIGDTPTGGTSVVPTLVFDDLPDGIFDEDVVTLEGILVPEPHDDTLCRLYLDPWLKEFLVFRRDQVVHFIPGADRPDRRTLLWVKSAADVDQVFRTSAGALASGSASPQGAYSAPSGPKPPPPKWPK
jgi:hypothetical protein